MPGECRRASLLRRLPPEMRMIDLLWELDNPAPRKVTADAVLDCPKCKPTTGAA